MVKRLRILVANEPRAYRDAHGGMLREIYPDTDIRMTEADDLQAAFAAFLPHLVICSAVLPEPVKTAAFSWVLLYPDEADLAIVCVNDRQTIIESITIQQLMDVVEEVARHVAAKDQSSHGQAPVRRAAEGSAEFDSSVSYCQ